MTNPIFPGTGAALGREAAAALSARLENCDGLDQRIAVVAREFEVPGRRLAFSSSLGLEDQALLDSIARIAPGTDVFVLDTGRHFAATLETLERTCLRYATVRIRVVAPDAGESEDVVARDGVMGFRSSIEARKACCDVRKVRPLRRALSGAAGWITGMRREQSAGRSDIPFAVWDDVHGLIKINPIADWSLNSVERYVLQHDVPVNRLHAIGYPSIGCEPCTRALKPGEDIRAGRWWWENEEGKECGLHMRGGPSDR